MKRIRKVIVHVTEKQEEAKPIVDTSPIITGAGEVEVLSGPDGNFEHALKWAKDNSTRLFTRAEAQYLFETSESFRKAVKGTCFWVLESASVISINRLYAWLFYGYYGYVCYDFYYSPRYYTYGVRAVGSA